MSTSNLGTTLGIIKTAAAVLGDPTINDIVDRGSRVANRADQAGSSITSFSAQTTILSRVFIDESIINEPILPNLMRSIHEWYAAQIISALQLSQLISDGRTVQSVMGIVQSGHNQHQSSVIGNIISKRIGMESFLANHLGEGATESPSVPLDKVSDSLGLEALPAVVNSSNRNLTRDPKKPDDTYSETTVRSVTASDNRIGPMGELFEIKMTNPNKDGQSMTVPVFIQMQPSIVPEEAAPRFIDMNVAPTLWQRWTQMRSGELTFMKDFILNRDLHRRQRTVLKDARTAKVFIDFLKTVAKKDSYALSDASSSGSTQSSNLANSVVIFSEETVMQAKIDSGIDLHKKSDRDRYFRDTYSMIVVIIDQLHQRVTIYFNGLDGDLNVSYAEFRPRDSKFDPQELMGALQAFSTNNISRMR